MTKEMVTNLTGVLGTCKIYCQKALLTVRGNEKLAYYCYYDDDDDDYCYYYYYYYYSHSSQCD